ncbi:hypothetical protein L6164_037514 [Bauhinia variegata]|uniref:Uncharacterized protein n=1 Tax=Bauhinia variegata TaxID=167791 RepID=A0ACB9KKD8_BAUVA|nr:hypothetical protein L6164_037514 [Bauhinia variegata]
MAAAIPSTQNKIQWGELEEDNGEDLDFLLPSRQVIGPDENGIKKAIEYQFDEDGNKEKTTTTTRTRKLANARLSKRALERRSWAKFNDAVHEDVGSRLTTVSTEEILLERPRAPVSQVPEQTWVYVFFFKENTQVLLFPLYNVMLLCLESILHNIGLNMFLSALSHVDHGEGIEGGVDQQAWEKWSNDGTKQQVAKLMDEDVGAAMQFLQSKVLCIMPISLASAIFRAPQADALTIIKPESNSHS